MSEASNELRDRERFTMSCRRNAYPSRSRALRSARYHSSRTQIATGMCTRSHGSIRTWLVAGFALACLVALVSLALR